MGPAWPAPYSSIALRGARLRGRVARRVRYARVEGTRKTGSSRAFLSGGVSTTSTLDATEGVLGCHSIVQRSSRFDARSRPLGLRSTFVPWARGSADGFAFGVISGPPQVQRVFELAGVADRVTLWSADGQTPVCEDGVAQRVTSSGISELLESFGGNGLGARNEDAALTGRAFAASGACHSPGVSDPARATRDPAVGRRGRTGAPERDPGSGARCVAVSPVR
jgi:hypothetical protein